MTTAVDNIESPSLAEDTAFDPSIGSVIRDYEIVRKLGRGGMGQVYLVRHHLLGIERALKLLAPGLLETEEARARFLREAALLASLHHPNIVTFYEFGALTDRRQFLVMEYLRGENLKTRLKRTRQPLPLDELLPFFVGICRGLEEAHRTGIVHRDVSSENLFFASGQSGEVPKLIDFGIALPGSTETFARVTTVGVFIGKCAYASPEQLGVLAGRHTLDWRTDLYALGATLYEALVGQNPFVDTELEAILKRKLGAPPPPPSEAAPGRGIPAPLDRVVSAMLQRDPDSRPGSVRAVRAVLERLMGERSVTPNASSGEIVDGATISRAADAAVGVQIGEYALEELIGRGATGRVFRARHRLLGVVRALKVIDELWAGDRGLRERFLLEAKILARLEHPNVVRVYDCSPLGGGSFYMVQELVSGESVRDLIEREGRLNPEEVAPLFAAAARGLGAAHVEGVVHRDVSPDNIMVVDSDGEVATGPRVKLIDFGIARAPIGIDNGRSPVEGFVGKFAYCAPEQNPVDGVCPEIDGRADVYALGVCLYHALTGTLPFMADSPQELLAMHRCAPVPLPGERGVDLPPELEELVLEMLAKEPEARPQTMDEVARRLETLFYIGLFEGCAVEGEDAIGEATVAIPIPSALLRAVAATEAAWAPGPARLPVLAACLALSAVIGLTVFVERGGVVWKDGRITYPWTALTSSHGEEAPVAGGDVERPRPGVVQPPPLPVVEVAPPTDDVAESISPSAVELTVEISPTAPESSPAEQTAPKQAERASNEGLEGDGAVIASAPGLTPPATTTPPAEVPKPKATAPPVVAPTLAERANAIAAEAGALERDGRVLGASGSSAVGLYREALRLDPDNGQAQARLEAIQRGFVAEGDLALQRGDFVAAGAAYETAGVVRNDATVADRLGALARAEAAERGRVAAVEAAYERARRLGTTAALADFLRAFPQAPSALRAEAEGQVVELQDDEAFARAVSRGDVASLNEYQAAYPGGRHSLEIQGRLDDRGAAARRAFEAAQAEGTARAYQRFLGQFADAPTELRQEAEARAASVSQAERESFERARRDGTRAALIDYVRRFPRGGHVHEVLDLLQAPKQGVLAQKLLSAAAARDPGLPLPSLDRPRAAMDFLSSIGMGPCDGVWDEDARLTPDDFRCVAGGNPSDADAPYVIEMPTFLERIRARLTSR